MRFAIVTADNSLAIYWEHVVAVTDDGYEVLDLRTGEDVTFYDHRVSRIFPACEAERSRNDFLGANQQWDSGFQ